MRKHTALRRSASALTRLALVFGCLAGPLEAGAFSVTATDLPDGSSHVDLGTAEVDASGGSFATRSLYGIVGTGVSGGYVAGEIDTSGESITFRFASPGVLTSLDLMRLYLASTYGDSANEAARVVVHSGEASYEGMLVVASATAATWSFVGGGPVATVSVPTAGGVGWFSIASPFGDLEIDSLELLPVDTSGQADHRNADYSFVALSMGPTQPVPEPDPALLVGSGLGGLLLTRRKRA
jgi:hypothetical protein